MLRTLFSLVFAVALAGVSNVAAFLQPSSNIGRGVRLTSSIRARRQGDNAFLRRPSPLRTLSRAPNSELRALAGVNQAAATAIGGSAAAAAPAGRVALAAMLAMTPVAFDFMDRYVLPYWGDISATLGEYFTTIVLSVLWALRIFKLTLMGRYLVEWLPQLNSYLPPWCYVYQATDNYLAMWRKLPLPVVFGIDVSGILAFTFLEFADQWIASWPAIAEEAL
uniref:YGGT family protein n=1 Tax=Chromera velia CCMP2878 TaxID=1169474 RepID=A0A0G4GCR4_9ALVE|mmetsp:Transcript_29001/g.56779  ORF Transcript_29001/g.56779 Transcript_29001/m.56779 type:complete len:222 (+) Transcript_29001:77-742(+)|eukprot:Cvel_21192.t1-p1 / transcript=Cvel_21192.t1 / gene=Cvel_21192 / organism=Chromera_velia_CCMP2878 / gene_product=Uncharacterized protein ycf19, putative / transcript_product=Uncharacterized protein ycf19, putative / location=Cvel_scaffold1967:11232-13952(-) / protein_length=221 / sequence_SO=supercontig / SO=protein_coding / is_pseudo=false